MDVVAVGLVSGHIIVHNIKFDESLMKFQQDWGPITAISFRTGKFLVKICMKALRLKKWRKTVHDKTFQNQICAEFQFSKAEGSLEKVTISDIMHFHHARCFIHFLVFLLHRK